MVVSAFDLDFVCYCLSALYTGKYTHTMFTLVMQWRLYLLKNYLSIFPMTLLSQLCLEFMMPSLFGSPKDVVYFGLCLAHLFLINGSWN